MINETAYDFEGHGEDVVSTVSIEQKLIYMM